jgi:hypothetical protein
VAPIGINGSAHFVAKRRMGIEVIDPLSGGVVQTFELNAGDGFDIGGPAAILRGQWK